MLEKINLKNTVIYILIAGVVIASLLLPRALCLDSGVTIDEPAWLMRSANFYQALAVRDFANTFQKEHPGVLVTWAGTAGFLWRFPEYITMVDHQFRDPANLHNFLRNRKVELSRYPGERAVFYSFDHCCRLDFGILVLLEAVRSTPGFARDPPDRF